MVVLFYRYGSICEPDIINVFKNNEISVVEETVEINNKNIRSSQRAELIHNAIQTHHPLFVFSINFFPSIAEMCHLHNTFYLCWTVDAPIAELFSKSIQLPTNRIFMFDKAQYEFFAPYNPTCIFHLPLAAAVERFDNILKTITPTESLRYTHDISFVGSLYSEKNPFHKLNLPPYAQGYINGIINSALKVYGYNLIEELVNDSLISTLKNAGATFYNNECTITNSDYHIAAHSYIGIQAAETERIQTLNKLAEFFNIDLYTRSDPTPLRNVSIHDGVKTLTEMPKVFRLSKINLNMTIKPIQTGLPLRIFDILGCGGFLMTNYQSEITEHFVIGTDLEAYGSLDELIDKCSYYLAHDDIRKKIAQNGYNKVKQFHTYQNRISQMLQLILS